MMKKNISIFRNSVKSKLYRSASCLTVVAVAMVLTQACMDPQSPGVEYMPDMYRTNALEPYSVYEAEWSQDSLMEARLPVEGTVPRGHMPYSLPNDTLGYRLSADVTSPFAAGNEAILEEGKVLYAKFCVHCHGDEGQGNGKVVEIGGHPPPPPYNSPNLKKLTEGTIFHVITYGKNAMGSHASQISQEDRWKIARYVQSLQQL